MTQQESERLETDLRLRLVRLYHDVVDATDGEYKPQRLRQMIADRPGVETASHLILSEDGTNGFWELIQRGLHELTVEYIALTGPWNQILAPEVLEVARERLRDLGGINI